MKDLKETVSLMTSEDYKERFKAEYYQLETRYVKLANMYEKMKAGTLEFTPTCPKAYYSRQLNRMLSYIKVLLDRAKLEKVELEIDDYVKSKIEKK